MPKKSQLKPAIKVKGKVITGKNHAQAIKKAQDMGYDVKLADRMKLGKFKTPKGLLTRKEMKKEYGISHSHEIKLIKNK